MVVDNNVKVILMRCKVPCPVFFPPLFFFCWFSLCIVAFYEPPFFFTRFPVLCIFGCLEEAAHFISVFSEMVADRLRRSVCKLQMVSKSRCV